MRGPFSARQALWATAVQAAAVATVAVTLALLLPGEFFEEWGRISGPVAWFGCAAFTAWAVGLRLGWVLAGAAIAGVPGLAFVVAGLHWVGTAAMVAVFGPWCGYAPEAERPGLRPMRGRGGRSGQRSSGGA